MSGIRSHDIKIRVRYQETDAQGRVHHANYLNYFEMGRVELLRANGMSYREIEQSGVMLVVAEITCKYHLPAQYDDELTLTTETIRARGARIDHSYELRRGNDRLVEGRSVIACIDHDGNIRRLPDALLLDDEPA